MSQIILPGDSLDSLLDEKNITIGPGLYQPPLSKPIPVKAGYINLQQKSYSGPSAYIESNGKRYIPSAKDHVIGVVIGKQNEGFKVLLQDGSSFVRLGQFAFENATKKNKPNLPTGTLVYGRIAIADKDIEVEMECFDATTGKAAGFGELKDGYVVEVSLAYARKLLFQGGEVLNAIGEIIPYEIAIGMNGKIWINGPDNLTILKIAECIKKSETIPEDNVKDLVTKLLSSRQSK